MHFSAIGSLVGQWIIIHESTLVIQLSNLIWPAKHLKCKYVYNIIRAANSEYYESL
jgi:hypothetical protein